MQQKFIELLACWDWLPRQSILKATVGVHAAEVVDCLVAGRAHDWNLQRAT